MKIPILDFGHGVDTPGKRSPVWSDGSQLFEWEFNRDIGMRIMSILENLGIPYFISTEEYKDTSLSSRVNTCNTIYKEEKSKENIAYVVSLHGNAGGGTGWEIYTSTGQTSSDGIAEVFYEHAKIAFPEFRMRIDGSDGDNDKESDFYILKNTSGPAVLIESFFMDTESDCKFMMSNEGRDRIAACYAGVIESLYNE